MRFKSLKLRLPAGIHNRLLKAAKASGLSVEDMLAVVLDQELPRITRPIRASEPKKPSKPESDLDNYIKIMKSRKS